MREIVDPGPVQLVNLATGQPLLKVNRTGDRVQDEPDDPMTLHRFLSVYILPDAEFSSEKHGDKLKALRAGLALEEAFRNTRLGTKGARLRVEEDPWKRVVDVIEKSATFRAQPTHMLMQCLAFIDALTEAKEVKVERASAPVNGEQVHA